MNTKKGFAAVLILAASILAVGCKTTTPQAQNELAGMAPALPTQPGPAPVPAPPVAPKRPLVLIDPIVEKKAREREEREIARQKAQENAPVNLAVANQKSTQTPVRRNVNGAVTVYDFDPTKVFKIRTRHQRVTVVMLAPDESVLEVANGAANMLAVHLPKERIESPAGSYETIILKPVWPDLKTNVIVTTTRRIYMLDVMSNEYDPTESDSSDFQMAVRWTYPGMEKVIKRPIEDIDPKFLPEAQNKGPNPASMNFSYDWKRSEEFSPVAVYDDGLKTYVKFPDDMQEAPVLYVDSGEGNMQVNSRWQGKTLVVDRLFKKAYVVLGEDKVCIQKDK